MSVIRMKRIGEFCQKLRGEPRGHKGFSMAETLVALIIVSLLSLGIATGVAFGANQYQNP